MTKKHISLTQRLQKNIVIGHCPLNKTTFHKNLTYSEDTYLVKDREIDSLLNAGKELNCNDLLVITLNKIHPSLGMAVNPPISAIISDTIRTNSHKIRVIFPRPLNRFRKVENESFPNTFE